MAAITGGFTSISRKFESRFIKLLFNVRHYHFGLPRFMVKEFEDIDVKDGYLIDGFPSVGFASAIATESLIHTTQFRLAGIIDSDVFPAVSLVDKGRPNYPTRIFVQNDLKVAVFSSYLTLHQALHKQMARLMLGWAKKHGVKKIITGVAVKSSEQSESIIAAGSTEGAREDLKKAGIVVLQHGSIPGLSGALLNQGMLNNQEVVAVLYNTASGDIDFRSSAKLCMAMSKLVPGVSCDLERLNTAAREAEDNIIKTDQEAQHLKEGMYR